MPIHLNDATPLFNKSATRAFSSRKNDLYCSFFLQCYFYKPIYSHEMFRVVVLNCAYKKGIAFFNRNEFFKKNSQCHSLWRNRFQYIRECNAAYVKCNMVQNIKNRQSLPFQLNFWKRFCCFTLSIEKKWLFFTNFKRGEIIKIELF